MSHGRGVPWPAAWELALEVARRLRPFVQRIEVAGSIRRRAALVGDIELVAEPLPSTDLFGPAGIDLEGLKKELEEIGEWVRGGDRYIRIRKVLGDRRLDLDLFLVHPPAEWGSILAIRTGPASLGKLCVAKMRDEGLQHTGGHVVETIERGETVPTPTEEEFFRLAGIPCMAPQYRESLAQRLGAF